MNEQDQQLNRSDVFEVNGVQFQAAIQSPIPIPILPWRKIPVRLGMFVTNNRSNRLYFNRLNSLRLTMFDGNDQEILFDSDLWRARVSGEPYYFLETTETQFFSFESTIYRNFCQLQLETDNEAGGFFYFRNLKPGNYQLSISYSNSGRLQGLEQEEEYSGKVWSGTVNIPVNFCLGSR